MMNDATRNDLQIWQIFKNNARLIFCIWNHLQKKHHFFLTLLSKKTPKFKYKLKKHSGGINKPKQPKSVIGLFRRESSGSRAGTNSIGGGDGLDAATSAPRGSDPALAAALSSMVVPSATSTAYNPRLDKRSQSISSGSGISEGHSGPFPVTASHRRNVRRGSMLELSGWVFFQLSTIFYFLFSNFF